MRDIAADQFGWWTFGISVTGTGMVHYYASPGVDDLTEDDFLTSQYPYGRQAERFETMFFNFCNQNDGRTWSTPFVIDDSRLYVVHSNRVASIVNAKKQHLTQQAAAKRRMEEQSVRQEQEAMQARARATAEARSQSARRMPEVGTGRRRRSSPEPGTELDELFR